MAASDFGWCSLLRRLLQGQDQPQTGIYIFQQLTSKAASLLGQEVAIYRDHLRDIGDRILWQARRFGRHQHIAGCVHEAKVGGHHDRDHGLQPASVEGICLDNQDRSAESGLGTVGFAKVGPPEIAALNYHAFLPSERA